MSDERGPAPFDLTCSPNVPELIRLLDMTLAVSTYQAGKLVFISALDDEKLVQLPRSFRRAMAIGVHGDNLALATVNTVEVMRNDRRLAAGYPRQPNTYDALFMPRTTYYTGAIDCHGLEWGTDGLWAVNTRFSSLVLLSGEYSFVPQWHPRFVTDLVPEDRCHLNSLAMQEGKPKYVTCLNTGDTGESWKKTLPEGGVVLDVESGEVVAGDLPMPHSARLVNDHLFVLFSATGELARVDTAAGTYEVVQRFQGFTRGMAYHRDHLFVAVSKIRKNSSSFRKLKIADDSNQSGIIILHVPTGTVVGRISYHQSVDEIFDVAVLPRMRRPGIVGTARPLHGFGLSLPEKALWQAQPKDQEHPRQGQLGPQQQQQGSAQPGGPDRPAPQG